MAILAIDDEPFALMLVEDILASRYEVVSFGDAREALKALQEGLEPDLILCDVSMPDLDGFEFHRLLRRSEALRGVPFIYLTALDDYDFFRRGMNLGADDYLTKPFGANELLDTVAARFARQAALRQQVARERRGASEPEHLSAEPGVLTVEALNGARVYHRGERVHWSVKRASAAFFYLLEQQHYHQQESVPNDKFRDALWSQPAQDNAIYVLTLRLRQIIEPFAGLRVAHKRVGLELTRPYRYDVDSFEKLAARAEQTGAFDDLQAAISSYSGPFLPDIDTPWTLARRNELEQRYFGVLRKGLEHAPNEAQRAQLSVRYEHFMAGVS